MKRNIITISLVFFSFLMVTTGCKEEKENEATDETMTEENMEEDAMTDSEDSSEITIEKLQGSPAFENAALTLNQPSNTMIKDGSQVQFDFSVENYELRAQTESPAADMLANSEKGQHIHFIINNQPYAAHYESSFKKDLPDGVHHMVAFLSRSYHESVKNDNSMVVKKITVGENPEDELKVDMEAPTLIYSRPKGTYSGNGTENLLLDFFVLNTTLSEDGNKVRATINGEEFMLTEWTPYIVKGLPMGEVTVQLELVDADGNLIEGPFNKVTRSVNLEA